MNSSITLNFVSKIYVKKLDLDPTSNKPPVITSIDSHCLKTYIMVQPTVCLCNKASQLIKASKPVTR